jgi:DNA-binding NarL/FixJ family response regulator
LTHEQAAAEALALLDELAAGQDEPVPIEAMSNADGLTPREIDVLRLLAAGRSNRQIAAELVISVRTAENHIAGIYSKTGAHGRAAAATYALTHGLIPPD